MIIGKIEIDLNILQSGMTTDELEVINLYLNGSKEIGTIRQLIEIIADNEVTLYTDEEFAPYHLYNKCEYNPVSDEQLQEFTSRKIIDPSKEVSPSYYANFLYIDGKTIDPVTGIKPIKVGFDPCLIEFSWGTMITYYIFDWYKEEGYFSYIEIED